MHPDFKKIVDRIELSFEKLLKMAPVKYEDLPKGVPNRGVYLFSEGDRHLYVGRSNKIRGRLGRHCRPEAAHRMEAFAFRLAQEATGNIKTKYTKTQGREALIKNEAFKAAFEKAKARIRNMDIRYTKETNPTRQAVLEIYCAVSLATPYNDFDTP